MFVHSFRVRNFMIHRDTEVHLHPITVFVGPNAGGKSALFDALLNFSLVSRGNIAQAFGPWPYSFHARKYHASAPAARISYEVWMSRDPNDLERLHYQIEYGQHGAGGDNPTYIIFNEKLDTDTKGTVLFDRSNLDSCPMKGIMKWLTNDRSVFATIRRAQVADDYEEVDSLVTHCAREISRFNKFRLDPSILARPGRLPEVSTDALHESRVPYVDHHGEDLASALYYLAETANPALTNLQELLSGVLEGFQEFEFNNVGVDRVGFSVKFADARGTVPAAHLSDGALALIGLLALVISPDRPPVLFIEEPENGLTPKATRIFYQAVHDLAFSDAKSQRSQVLISSHSPFVICEAWNGEDRDFIYQVRPRQGEAVVRPFSGVIEEEGIQLEMDKTRKRTRLNLNVADQVMAGFWS